MIAQCVLLDFSLTQEAALLAKPTVNNAQMLVHVFSAILDSPLLMEDVFKVQLRPCLQPLLVEFQLFALLDVLPAHLQLFALHASKVFHYKEIVAYNAIRLAELVL